MEKVNVINRNVIVDAIKTFPPPTPHVLHSHSKLYPKNYDELLLSTKGGAEAQQRRVDVENRCRRKE